MLTVEGISFKIITRNNADQEYDVEISCKLKDPFVSLSITSPSPRFMLYNY